jgi:hypothetical protein
LTIWGNEFSIDLANELEIVMDQVREEFPPPSEAPNHEQRVEIIGTVLTRVEGALVKVTRKYNIDEDKTRDIFRTMRPGIENTLILVG